MQFVMWLWRSEDMLNYLDHMDALTQQLIELLTEGLGVTSERLTEFHDNTTGSLNVHQYPACPRPELARNRYLTNYGQKKFTNKIKEGRRYCRHHPNEEYTERQKKNDFKK